MRIVSDVFTESGKSCMNLGQAIVIAALVSRLFTQKPVGGGIVMPGIFTGMLFVIIGLISTQESHRLRKLEEQYND